jgi:hypothetical protein
MHNNLRFILFQLRNGDYAHAGEEEAIDLVIKNISATGSVLDVGSGFGGTLNYFHSKGFFMIVLALTSTKIQ